MYEIILKFARFYGLVSVDEVLNLIEHLGIAARGPFLLEVAPNSYVVRGSEEALALIKRLILDPDILATDEYGKALDIQSITIKEARSPSTYRKYRKSGYVNPCMVIIYFNNRHNTPEFREAHHKYVLDSITKDKYDL